MVDALNWIERRAMRETNLRNQATDVWESVRTAVDNCCRSFNKHYSARGQAISRSENGARILVEIMFVNDVRRSISVEFSEGDKLISITVDDGPAIRFRIEADESHAFLSDNDKEITADDLTKRGLERALFEVPKPRASFVRPPGFN